LIEVKSRVTISHDQVTSANDRAASLLLDQ